MLCQFSLSNSLGWILPPLALGLHSFDSDDFPDLEQETESGNSLSQSLVF